MYKPTYQSQTNCYNLPCLLSHNYDQRAQLDITSYRTDFFPMVWRFSYKEPGLSYFLSGHAMPHNCGILIIATPYIYSSGSVEDWEHPDTKPLLYPIEIYSMVKLCRGMLVATDYMGGVLEKYLKSKNCGWITSGLTVYNYNSGNDIYVMEKSLSQHSSTYHDAFKEWNSLSNE